MAYELPNGAIVEITVRYEISGQTCLNIGHWRWASTEETDDARPVIERLAAALDNVEDGLSTCLSLATTTEVTIREIVAQMIYPERFARIVLAPQVTAGTIDPPTTPANWVAVGTKRTEMAGPRGHGSIFVSGFDAAAIAVDRIAAEAVSLITTYVGWFEQTHTDVVAGGSWNPIIFNRTTPAASPLITSISVSNEPRSLRRRALRAGI